MEFEAIANPEVVFDAIHESIDHLIDVDEANQTEMLNCLLDLIRLRHDSVHRYLAYKLGAISLNVERSMSYYIENCPSSFSELTPDMFIMTGSNGVIVSNLKDATRIIICDISVSLKSNLEVTKKIGKYSKIQSYLQDIGKDTDLFMFDVKPNLANFNLRMSQFASLFEITYDDSEIVMMKLVFERISRAIQEIKKLVSNEKLVNRFFEAEFGDGSEKVEKCEGVDINFNERIENMFSKSLKDKRRNQVLNEHIIKSMDEIEKNNQKKHLEVEEIFNTGYNEVVDICKELLADDEVMNYFYEKETSSERVGAALSVMKNSTESFAHTKTKPTHHLMTPLLNDSESVVYTTPRNIDLGAFEQLRTEQKQIVSILSLVKSDSLDPECFQFVEECYNALSKSLSEHTDGFSVPMFNFGIVQDADTEKSLRKDYDEHKRIGKENRSHQVSYIDFLRKEKSLDVPRNEDTRIFKQKMVRISLNDFTDSAASFWKKSHSGFVKEKKFQKKQRQSCQFNQAESLDKFIDMLAEPVDRMYTHTKDGLKSDVYQEFYTHWKSCDAKVISELKERMTNEFRTVLQEVRSTKAYHYLYRQSLVAEQLMHFQQFTLPTNSFSFFTAGMPNVCYIINNSYHDQGKDVGKAFLVCGYVDDDRWISDIYGKVHMKKLNGYSNKKLFLFCTEWRRLETFKCTFLKDQFFSIMSTSINGLLRHKDKVVRQEGYKRRAYTPELLKHHFVMKVAVCLSTNQKTAEMLADMRYAVMAAFAEFSEIEKLCIDKFSPPYSSVVEVWIASRVKNLQKLVQDYVEGGVQNIFFKQPVFKGKKRVEDSVGGRFDIPSIWDGVIINDIQDLLDDMFLYVHTLKEPSNIHHENVKSVKTILEYQKKYQGMTTQRKQGNLKTTSDIKDFLLDKDNNIGHVNNTVKVSSYRTMHTLGGIDWTARFQRIFNEPIANITSTKAAIPEYDREMIVQKSKRAKRKQEREMIEKSLFANEYSTYLKAKITQTKPMLLKTKIPRESFLPNKNRSKVHDCVLDVIEQNNYLQTVFDLAEWNVNKNSSKTVADICIKAQYGAKREFYVINVGSKACARVLENMFNEICAQLPNEMISIPGDKKMLYMQDFLNQALSRKKANETIFFVNGDCTKWSAAETMECFASMIVGMQPFVGEEFLKYFLLVINMWGNKDITIPISILQNTFFRAEGLTDYLDKSSATLESDQNFLQGMFNYMSSFKAVCCSNMTKEVWKSLYPNSGLRMEHMEHSDDYSLIVSVKDIAELKKFRALHRIMMKMHGVNDSVKKTNTQTFLMEFISLVCFNGHMTYPHIKKLKECGMNLGCTGYRDDIDSAMSRVGEAVRVGVPLTAAYFMQRMHLANIYKSYSLLKNQRNNFQPITDAYDTPIEIFGLPDTHPILSLICKGLPNNYRLLKFATKKRITITQKGYTELVDLADIFKILYVLEETETNLNSTHLNSDFTEGLRLFHPTYTFDIENNLVKNIRDKVKTTKEEAMAFWNDHKSYNFIKPTDRDSLVTWMRTMYFKHTFTMAYSRNSRSQITLRLSTFTSKPCLMLTRDKERAQDPMTIIDYMDDLLSSELDIMNTKEFIDNFRKYTTDKLEKATMNNDSTVTMFYSFFANTTFVDAGVNDMCTVATLSPSKISWLSVDNPVDSLIQYMFNYEDFIKDARSNKGLASLEADKKAIESYYNQTFDETTPLFTIKSVYTDLILSLNRKNLCMTYKFDTQTLEDFLKTHIEMGSIHNRRLSLSTAGITEAINPHNLDVYFKKLKTYTKNPYRSLIDDCSLLYGVLRHCYNIELDLIKKVLQNLHVKELDYDIQNLENLNGEYMFNNLEVSQLRQLGFNTNEIKSFAFLKTFLTDDVTPLLQVLNDNMIYKYQYVHVEDEFANFFVEACLIEYRGLNFKVYKSSDYKLLIVAEVPARKFLSDVYLITLKVFNIIRQSEFEKSIAQTSIKSVLDKHNEQGWSKRYSHEELRDMLNKMNVNKIMTKVGARYTFEKFTNAMDLQNLLFVVAPIIANLSAGHTEQFNKKVDIQWDTNSVFMGNKKIFTLPILSCTQSNITMLNWDLDLNGINCNWWLQLSRLQHLVHNEDVPVNKNEFCKFGKFAFSKEKGMFSIRLRKVLAKTEALPFELESLDIDEVLDRADERIKFATYNTDNMPPTRVKEDDGTTQQFREESSEEEEDEEDDYQEDDMGQLSREAMMRMMGGGMMGGGFMKSMTFSPMIEVESEEEEDNYEAVAIKEDTESSQSDEKSTYSDEFLTAAEFRQMVPKRMEKNTEFVKGSSHSVNELKKIGDPTFYIINNNLVTKGLMTNHSPAEKVALMYRLKQILCMCDYITDMELLQCTTLLNEVEESLERRDEWTIEKDIVIRLNKDSNFQFFMKCLDNVTSEIREKVKLKGGLTTRDEEGDPWIYIPLSEQRTKSILNNYMENLLITTYLPMQTIDECYQRLFSRPFKRTGFLLQLLDEI